MATTALVVSICSFTFSASVLAIQVRNYHRLTGYWWPKDRK